jgi:hypothetical protein
MLDPSQDRRPRGAFLPLIGPIQAFHRQVLTVLARRFAAASGLTSNCQFQRIVIEWRQSNPSANVFSVRILSDRQDADKRANQMRGDLMIIDKDRLEPSSSRSAC